MSQKEMIELMIMQLEGAIQGMSASNAPERVQKAASEFIDSLKEWAKGMQ
jgi:hypothetical protein